MDCILTRSNFKEMRMKYHINQKDIAKRANVSHACVNRFENKNTGKYFDHVETTKPYELMILRALEDMIDEGYSSEAMHGGVKNGGKIMGRLNILDNPSTEYSTIINNIKIWLKNNNVSQKEFLDLCGLSGRVFETKVIEKRGAHMSEYTKNKIEEATGWKYADILSGAINKEETKMSYIPAKKFVDNEDKTIDEKAEALKNFSPSTQDIISEQVDRSLAYYEAKSSEHDEKVEKGIFMEKHVEKNIPTYDEAVKIGAKIQRDELVTSKTDESDLPTTGYTIINEKYTYYAETGEYVYTYDVVRRYKRTISKEAFIDAIKDR